MVVLCVLDAQPPSSMQCLLDCPRAGPGQGRHFFADPDPDPQGQGQANAGPGPDPP